MLPSLLCMLVGVLLLLGNTGPVDLFLGAAFLGFGTGVMVACRRHDRTRDGR